MTAATGSKLMRQGRGSSPSASAAAEKSAAVKESPQATNLKYVETDGNRQDQFEGFSSITAGAAVDESGE